MMIPEFKIRSIAGVRKLRSTLRTGCASFRQSESGAMSYVAIAGAMILMVFGGAGIDMISTELKRNKIQSTLDRAVLAAADLEQVLDPEDVVTDYMDKMNLGDALNDVRVDHGLNYKRVTADASVTTPTNFMSLIGIENMQAKGAAQAEEKIAKVEISMVLDISGSMAENNKLRNLRSAADTFVDTVLNDNTKDLISISLVPYSEQVNAGPLITEQMNVDWKHGYSHCLEFPDSQFNSTVLNTSMTYEQMQHFQWNYSGSNDRTDTVCPRYNYERIAPFSQNATALKNQIAQFQPRAGTSIFMGMKWGTALLDPSTRGIATGLINSGSMDAEFSGRPVNYDDTETLKTVVLMTDGQHDRSFRIQDWAYNSSSEVAQWERYNLWYYLARYVRSSSHSSFYTQKYNANLGDSLLDNICDAAKEKGIVIWSIGFEVSDHGADVMKNCASSASHFFRVEGTEIEDAFYSIARAINQLRLTQ
ncbi:Tad domain-containing protein [Puniceibacterium sp. IMCC21224]|uniref:Tad domain-containing protein n=1 Tax=Puniceibacterium sp. IMCC21224 TaxID=1618204 RepID=UPI00065CF867|nr:Tad domain-containing protein [Puniceibacterium sp. IMCC21224]KMK66336.1 putative Flp pilus-assembly TadE/G-like/von Willebrand factor type A domain [Puniceibacterium sp. IMCC21224]